MVGLYFLIFLYICFLKITCITFSMRNLKEKKQATIMSLHEEYKFFHFSTRLLFVSNNSNENVYLGIWHLFRSRKKFFMSLK